MLRGVDRAAFATAFATRLRAQGVAVGLTGVEVFVRALAACPPDSRSRLYWTARTALVHRQEEVAGFDAVFRAAFDEAELVFDARGHRGRPPPQSGRRPDDVHAVVRSRDGAGEDGGGLPWATLPRVSGPAADGDSPLGVPARLPSDLQGLADVPFDQLEAADLELLGQWLTAARAGWPTRRTRRFAVDHAGHRVAVRPTIARVRRTGWEAVTLVRTRPVRKPRRVVLLCDVSQSMQAQATAYLHLMRALAAGTADAEVFAFATGLTRLTAVLAHREPAVAIELATEKVADRFGGTRIATNVQALLSSHHGGATRGAVVVIASDGWDSDPPAQLSAAMARLRRRAHRVVWLNPRAGAPGFEPKVAPMAAALPFCDELLPASTFRDLATALTSLAPHPSRRITSSTG